MKRKKTDQKNRPSRLKRQPKLKRVEATAASSPRVSIPRTAINRRRRNRQRITIPTVAIWGVISSPRWISLGLLIATIYSLITIGSSLDFYLTVIPVEGVVSIAPEEIVATSQLAGRHIFAADPNEAAGMIAETAGITEAAVKLNWPNEVRISVVEDRPIAIWEQAGQSFWINRHGQLLPARTELPGLLRIQTDSPAGIIGFEAPVSELNLTEDNATEEEASSSGRVPIGRAPAGKVPDEILKGALMLQKLQPGGQIITEISFQPDMGLSFVDARGWEVFMGTGLDMDQKLVLHDAIVSEITAQGQVPLYVSVSNKEKPFFKATE